MVCGGSWSAREKPPHTRGEHANSSQKGRSWDSNQGCPAVRREGDL